MFEHELRVSHRTARPVSGSPGLGVLTGPGVVAPVGGTRPRRRIPGAEQLVASLGGTVEAYYFGFGSDDFYLIATCPATQRPPPVP